MLPHPMPSQVQKCPLCWQKEKNPPKQTNVSFLDRPQLTESVLSGSHRDGRGYCEEEQEQETWTSSFHCCIHLNLDPNKRDAFGTSCFSLLKVIFLSTYMFTVKSEKKTVQFSDEVQVETIEPEPEPVYIDEVCTKMQ